MSDFLTRLAQRAVGQAPVLEPLVRAWGAAEPEHVDAEFSQGDVEQIAPATSLAPERNVAHARPEVARAPTPPMAMRATGVEQAARVAATAPAAHVPSTPLARTDSPVATARAREDYGATARASEEDGHANSAIERRPTGESLLLFSEESRPAWRALEPRPESGPSSDVREVTRVEGHAPPRISEAESVERRVARPPRETGHDVEPRQDLREAAVATGVTPSGVGPVRTASGSPAPLARASSGVRDMPFEAGQAAEAPEDDVSVSVSIGRVIVRPASPPAAPTPARAPVGPAKDPRMTLDQYLASRNRR